MPRYARIHVPGSLVHVIARFTNRQYRLAGPRERGAFEEDEKGTTAKKGDGSADVPLKST